eukprot:1865939-Rhodomonas_salina.3
MQDEGAGSAQQRAVTKVPMWASLPLKVGSFSNQTRLGSTRLDSTRSTRHHPTQHNAAPLSPTHLNTAQHNASQQNKTKQNTTHSLTHSLAVPDCGGLACSHPSRPLQAAVVHILPRWHPQLGCVALLLVGGIDRAAQRVVEKAGCDSVCYVCVCVCGTDAWRWWGQLSLLDTLTNSANTGDFTKRLRSSKASPRSGRLQLRAARSQTLCFRRYGQRPWTIGVLVDARGRRLQDLCQHVREIVALHMSSTRVAASSAVESRSQ